MRIPTASVPVPYSPCLFAGKNCSIWLSRKPCALIFIALSQMRVSGNHGFLKNPRPTSDHHLHSR